MRHSRTGAYVGGAIAAAALAAASHAMAGAAPRSGAGLGHPAAADPAATVSLVEEGRPLGLSLASGPESRAWTLMLVGIGGVGALARRRALSAA